MKKAWARPFVATVLTMGIASGTLAAAPGASAIASPPRTQNIVNWSFLPDFNPAGWSTWGVYATVAMAQQAMNRTAARLAQQFPNERYVWTWEAVTAGTMVGYIVLYKRAA